MSVWWAGARTDPNLWQTFAKEAKSYVYDIDGGPTTKIQFPKDDKKTLHLMQRYLVFQIKFPVGAAFALEITLTDTGRSKRRLHFSTAFRELQSNPLHCRIPFPGYLPRDCWLNIVFDMEDLVALAFPALLSLRSIKSYSIHHVLSVECLP